jgi:hypothetical protein
VLIEALRLAFADTRWSVAQPLLPAMPSIDAVPCAHSQNRALPAVAGPMHAACAGTSLTRSTRA